MRSRAKSTLWVIVYRWLMNNGYEYCRLCNTKDDLTFEHILPRAFGGSDEINNISILCAPCNNGKGADYYGFLEPVSWPPPHFTLKNAADICIGDMTPRGEVVGKHFVSERTHAVWNLVVDTSNAIIRGTGRHCLIEVSTAQDYLIVPAFIYANKEVLV